MERDDAQVMEQVRKKALAQGRQQEKRRALAIIRSVEYEFGRWTMTAEIERRLKERRPTKKRRTPTTKQDN